MSLLKKIFGSNEISRTPKKIIPWNRLTSVNQLIEIEKESFHQPIAIFKHSTRCGTSSMALRQFESQFEADNTSVKLYFLDLLSFKDISNEIAIRFQVFHESPQLIVLKDGNTIHHSSHHQIDAGLLEQFS
ncbi:MAG: bacillithiol system redox-active protein YtxJ [Flavobacteriaceae bacterium]|jgi:bacillithiol system protein YtxJ|tara:strand:+ start:252 stop:644 length:393 start_codon:yes stop_codon:yes gene_type:complete